MDLTPELAQRIAVIAGLEQPVRRDLFQLLSRSSTWASRDEAAEAIGISRALAAFHLDKLVDAGLAEARFERRTGRSGPGAGRPAKLYRRTATEVAASIPDRHYDLAAAILADAVAESAASGDPVAGTLGVVAHRVGSVLGGQVRDTDTDDDAEVERALRASGYEPELSADGTITLGNCPFHRLAERHRDLVCGMNVHLVSGILDGLGTAADRLTAQLHPSPGHCCARIVADAAAGSSTS
jgi:predicted ArsR family transcriptional regulator